MSVDEKVNKETGPYKLLALDGGGIRGLVPLRSQPRSRRSFGKRVAAKKVFLADYFDYIAGTAGAIIRPVSPRYACGKIRDFYLKTAKDV